METFHSIHVAQRMNRVRIFYIYQVDIAYETFRMLNDNIV